MPAQKAISALLKFILPFLKEYLVGKDSIYDGILKDKVLSYSLFATILLFILFIDVLEEYNESSKEYKALKKEHSHSVRVIAYKQEEINRLNYQLRICESGTGIDGVNTVLSDIGRINETDNTHDDNSTK